MKCGNCNIDFQNERAMVAHMILIHNSPFDLSHDAHMRYKGLQESILADADLQKVRGLLHGVVV